MNTVLICVLMSNFKDIDRTKTSDPYIRAIEDLPRALKESYVQVVKEGNLSLEGKEITKSILFRLKAYYICQNTIKEFLNKKYICPAADFFVESVVFYLKAYISKNNLDLEVASELKLKRQHNSPRPDISIWRNGSLVAVIECKTQLGRNRDNWKVDLNKCRNKIKEIYPNAEYFYVVMTKINWSGFGEDKDVGKKLFTFSKLWPVELDEHNIDDNIINPIEDLIRQLV